MLQQQMHLLRVHLGIIFGRIKRRDKRSDLIGHHLRTGGGWWTKTFAFSHLRQSLMSKLPWISALTAAELHYQCEGPHKGSWIPESTTWCKSSRAFSPKRSTSRGRKKDGPPGQNVQVSSLAHTKFPELPRNKWHQATSLPSALPSGPWANVLSEHDLCSRDLDVSIRSHDAGKWKSSEQIAGRALPWNLHATIVQITIYAYIYIYISVNLYPM